MIVGDTGVVVGVRVGVLVGGTEVAVAVGVRVGVLVGVTGVAVSDGVGVLVGGTAVGVLVGGTGVAVGVLVGGTGVAVHVGVCVGLTRGGRTVYVHCTAEINRSPSTIIAYLHWVQRQELGEAVWLVTSRHACDPYVTAIAQATPDGRENGNLGSRKTS